ncbi:MAG: hypothetical protein MZW92_19840 [Comamonadaceae bacterium]|nr:hypothetical protein [Comamonadaceae bacterium]
MSRRRFLAGILACFRRARDRAAPRSRGPERAQPTRSTSATSAPGARAPGLLRNFPTVERRDLGRDLRPLPASGASARPVSSDSRLRARPQAVQRLSRIAGRPRPSTRSSSPRPTTGTCPSAWPPCARARTCTSRSRSGHTLAQNQAMLEACRNTGRIFQYGTQQRSQEMHASAASSWCSTATSATSQRIDVWAPGGQGGGSLDGDPGAGRARLRALHRSRRP